MPSPASETDPAAVSWATSSDRSWFAEIDLSPDHTHPAMGTRSLGDRPWLVVDDLRDAELAYKAWLLAERSEAVFGALTGAEQAAAETLSLVEQDLAAAGVSSPDRVGDLHPLDEAGRLVQEDLCLVSPGVGDQQGLWILHAAALCFPSQWSLKEKIGQPMMAVHGPVPGYRDQLSRRVDSLFGRLGDRVVWRRNWFIHADADLHQPARPRPVVVPAERALSDLFLRSERQTLRRLPASGWVLFTIKTQHCPLDSFIADPGDRNRLAAFVTETSPDLANRHGLEGDQREQLRLALDR